MKTTLIASLCTIGLVIAIVAVLTLPNTTPGAPGSNVSIINGIQHIDLTAKGGYAPLRSVAQADIPTILRVNTNGTYDCSASIRIPSLQVDQLLPATGQTEINLGTPKAGKLAGSCGMGMFPFEVEFVN